MSSRLSWKPTVFWTLVFFSLVIFTFMHRLQLTWKPSLAILQHQYFGYNLQSEEPIDVSQTCQIPRIHPFDPSILSYLIPPKPIKCKVRQDPLTFIDEEGVLRFNETSLVSSGFDDHNIPSCTYQEVIRPEAQDIRVTYGEKKPLPRNGTKLNKEFIFVSCYNFAGIAFYSNIHLHIIPSVLKKKPVHKVRKGSGNEERYNVLVLGIDSLSRLSFIRYLPKTYSYLSNEMKAYIFRGMTKVGDNTFPNLAAVLTGKSVSDNELPIDTVFDDWPYIWKNFSERGYATMFAEDRPDIALFNYLRAGFKNPPTDHYLRPYWLAAEASSVHMLSSHLCFGTVPKHQLQLNYTKDFVNKYSKDCNRRFFGFSFFVELSHDYNSQVSVADDDLNLFLSELHNSEVFKRTFLFFLSDHGHRFDPMRATLVGRIEERMPFFAMVVPPSFLLSHPEVVATLNVNLGRLTSPYDIYVTLLDVLSYNTETETDNMPSRGSSLFHPISANRTCELAGIPDHYCTCEEQKPLDPQDDESITAADVLLNYINNFIEEMNCTSACSKLELMKIHRVDLIVPSEKVILNSRVYFGNLVEDKKATGMISKLRIVIQTSPGDAMFEGTLLYREDDDDMVVLGDISRINKYGDQSWCVNDAVLRKFCFCRLQRTSQSI